jgi:hypothetical protein
LFNGTGAGGREMYFARLSSSGTELTAPFEVTDSPSADATEPSVAAGDDGYVSAAWIDRRDGNRRVYYQLINPSYSPIDANQPISAAVPEYMQSPHTDAARGRAWFVWSDPRQYGLSIYASNLIYDPTDIPEKEPTDLPDGFTLHQNYPNPFNPSTRIDFSLPQAARVTLTVYNVLGRQVTVLADGQFSAGDHSIIWDGMDRTGEPVAGGMYLYRLSAGDITQTRKMLLVK